MQLAVVINTCAGSLDPEVRNKKGSFGSSKRYDEREAKLWEVIERYADLGERLIVVGEWCAAPGYTYVHLPGPTKSPVDPLVQRHAGARFAANMGATTVVFLNDDHFIEPVELDLLQTYSSAYPTAYSFVRAVKAGGLRNGREDGWPGYIMGHACAMNAAALAAVPWKKVPATPNWDVEHTKVLREAGVGIIRLADITAWDIEYGELP